MTMRESKGPRRALSSEAGCEGCKVKAGCGARSVLAGLSGGGPVSQPALPFQEYLASVSSAVDVLGDGRYPAPSVSGEGHSSGCWGRGRELTQQWRPPGCGDFGACGQGSGCGCKGNGGEGCKCPPKAGAPPPLPADLGRDYMAIEGPDGQPLSGAFSVLARSAFS